jgi:hypothetical protein
MPRQYHKTTKGLMLRLNANDKEGHPFQVLFIKTRTRDDNKPLYIAKLCKLIYKPETGKFTVDFSNFGSVFFSEDEWMLFIQTLSAI